MIVNKERATAACLFPWADYPQSTDSPCHFLTMDRFSFLDSLPFLVPCPSITEIPVPPPKSTAQQCGHAPRTTPIHGRGLFEGGPSEDVHLKLSNHQLSIEPLSGSDSDPTNVGVAFFDVDGTVLHHDDDPALTPCDLEFRTQEVFPCSSAAAAVARTSHPAHTSYSHYALQLPTTASARAAGDGGLSSLSHPSPTVSRRASQQEVVVSSQSVASLVLKLRNAVYLVNWTQLTRVQVLEGHHPSPGTESSGPEKTPALPSCLLLYFPSCLFRIFTLENVSTPTQSHYGAIEAALLRLVTESNSTRPFLSLSDWDLVPPSPPSKSDSTSSTTGGSSGGSSSSLLQDPDAAAQREALFLHQQRAHLQCWSGFQSLWSLLTDQPIFSSSLMLSSVPTDESGNNTSRLPTNLGRDMAHLITSIAQDLATSMGSTSESFTDRGHRLEQRHHQLAERLQDTRLQLESVINDIFPAPRSRKRQRVTSSASVADRETAALATVNPAPLDPHHASVQVEALMQQHKCLIHKRHELLRLPTR